MSGSPHPGATPPAGVQPPVPGPLLLNGLLRFAAAVQRSQTQSATESPVLLGLFDHRGSRTLRSSTATTAAYDFVDPHEVDLPALTAEWSRRYRDPQCRDALTAWLHHDDHHLLALSAYTPDPIPFPDGGLELHIGMLTVDINGTRYVFDLRPGPVAMLVLPPDEDATASAPLAEAFTNLAELTEFARAL